MQMDKKFVRHKTKEKKKVAKKIVYDFIKGEMEIQLLSGAAQVRLNNHISVLRCSYETKLSIFIIQTEDKTIKFYVIIEKILIN